MSSRIPRPCGHPGCPGLAVPGESYCQAHLQETQREYDRQRGSAAARGYDARWRRLRAMVLAEEPLCRECARQGRITPATQVDHIVPLRQGGTNERSNLQPLCDSCHSRKTAMEDGRWGGRAGTVVTIVCGPPGSGKTTYVRERMQRGDLIVDLDAIYAAVSGLPWYDKPDQLLPFVAAARDAMLERLQRPSTRFHKFLPT